MNDQLLEYYERELAFLRKLGGEFAEKYPKIAKRLLLRPNRCEDPHVERMIEAFAFLAARVHLKIDDELPEVSESFLNVLYPHYLAAIPSMAIVQFALDAEQGNLTTGYEIKRDTTLYSRPINGTHCRFRTSYPVMLWPIKVTAASIESRDPVDMRGRWFNAELKLSLRCHNGVKLSQLTTGDVGAMAEPISTLRFYLHGDARLVHYLYETLFNHATRVELRDIPTGVNGAVFPPPKPGAARPDPVVLPPASIKQVGFEADEAMLPYTARSFAGYRLLSEYFTFPSKFLFFDLVGIDAAARNNFGERFDIVIQVRDIAPPPSPLDATNFQLGCTPIINLFQKTAEPIHLQHHKHEYHVLPDVHRQMATEIYSVDAVTTANPYQQTARHFSPFYSYSHAKDKEESGSTFWYATRRPSHKIDDEGTEIYLSLVDLGFDPNVPTTETITVHTTCTNRDLPGKLRVGDGDFELETSAPILPVRCLKKPTHTSRPPLRRGTQWRLISHLSLNPLSLVENETSGAPEALQEILLLYDFHDSSATRHQITGITRVETRRKTRRMNTHFGPAVVRGIETTIEFDEENYVGSGIFLFASVLERFLGLYVSINSFNQLVVKTKQREGVLKRWQPRAGEQIII